jgi:hypothetical protein
MCQEIQINQYFKKPSKPEALLWEGQYSAKDPYDILGEACFKKWQNLNACIKSYTIRAIIIVNIKSIIETVFFQIILNWKLKSYSFITYIMMLWSTHIAQLLNLVI